MPALSEYSDGDTVVGGPSGPSAYARGPKLPSHTESVHEDKHSAGKRAVLDDLTTSAKTIQEELFLVKIAKDGLPAALRKLDEQLNKVRPSGFLHNLFAVGHSRTTLLRPAIIGSCQGRSAHALSCSMPQSSNVVFYPC